MDEWRQTLETQGTLVHHKKNKKKDARAIQTETKIPNSWRPDFCFLELLHHKPQTDTNEATDPVYLKDFTSGRCVELTVQTQRVTVIYNIFLIQ